MKIDPSAHLGKQVELGYNVIIEAGVDDRGLCHGWGTSYYSRRYSHR
ncbi:hypothetical protein [Alkalihalobacillus pseudalcaliphilus]|nr:hypothetical protein [Alkalihalobacillus pseudalcaliphilus]